MSDSTSSNARVSIVRDFASSDLFDRTFKEGMALVEETAAYLDGDGRRDSRLLPREDALLYAGESMRLTTRLMQIASWLLVQRAVREGDMPAQDACDEKYRIAALNAVGTEKPQALPGGLLNLLDRSNRLYERISHMDKRMFIDGEAEEIAVNPVMSQMAMLHNAFAGESFGG
jgi:regulator of CtrA degradation